MAVGKFKKAWTRETAMIILGAGSLLAGTAALAAYCWKKGASSTRTTSLSLSTTTTTTTTTTATHNSDSIITKNNLNDQSTKSSISPQSSIPPSKDRNYDDHPQNPQDSADDQAKTFADSASKHYSEKNYEEAIDGFTKALELVPDNFRFYTNRAMAHLARKNYQEAFSDAKASVDLDSTSKGHYTLGRSAQGLRKYDEAIQAYEEVLTFNEPGTSEYAKKALQRCYKQMAQRFVNDHYKPGEDHPSFKERVGDFGNIPEHTIQRAWKKKKDSDRKKELKRKEEGMQSQGKESIPSETNNNLSSSADTTNNINKEEMQSQGNESIPSKTENNLPADTNNNITNQEATNNVTIQEATDNATTEGETDKEVKERL